MTATHSTDCKDRCFEGLKADKLLLASFLPAIALAIYRYDLLTLNSALFGLDFERQSESEFVRASDLSLGFDHLFHVIITFVIFHNVCAFVSAAYCGSRSGPAIVAICSSAFSYLTLTVFLPPHGVLAEYIDDVIIVPGIVVGIANVVTSITNKQSRTVRMAAGLVMMMVLAENGLCQIAISKPSEELLTLQREWMAKTLALRTSDLVDVCRANGYVCAVKSPDGDLRAISDDPGPHLNRTVIAHVINAAKKYGIPNDHMKSGVPFDMRHGAISTEMGIMRYSAFKIAESTEPVVVIDAVVSSESMLWFHTLFGVHFVIVGSVLVFVIALSMGAQRR